MTITQYSKIQQRRGLSTDLPSALEDGEIGQVIDERRLYIGNGQVVDGAPTTGNTEILTEFSPNTDLMSYTYIGNDGVDAITGSVPNTPVIRTIQETLDDHLSIKAYDVKGDNITDDIVCINRAMQDVYTASPSTVASRREIFFPAGIYLINADYMYLPTMANLVGEGMDKTFIIMTDTTKSSVVKTADSLFQNDLQLGTNSAVLPTGISVRGITFQHMGDQNVISLERASNVLFENCKLLGAWTSGFTSSSIVHLDPIGAIYQHRNIKFKNCEFGGATSVTNLDATGIDAAGVVFEGCRFLNLYQGIMADNVSGDSVEEIKVVNCHFENVLHTCIYAGANSKRIISNTNTYVNCGSAGSEVVIFDGGSDECVSAQDTFKLSPLVRAVLNLSETSLVVNAVTDFILSNLVITTKHPAFNLQASQTNASTNIVFDITRTDSAFIDYTLKRNGFSRIGRLFLVTDGTIAGTDLGDMFTESGSTGITFDFNLTGNTLTVLYTSDASGIGHFHHQYKTWLMENPIILQLFNWVLDSGGAMVTNTGDQLVFLTP